MVNDQFGFEMAPQTVAADTTTPRVFGILNIIFSLLAACVAAYALAMALVLPMLGETMKEAAKEVQESSEVEIKALEEKEASATTEEEKAELRAEREALEIMAKAGDANPFEAMNDPIVHRYGLIDGSTGLFFNLLLFISGVGLLFRKEWARKLALWTAAMKIVRLFALQSYNVMVVVPIKAKSAQEMIERMDMGNGGAATAEMGQMQGVMLTAFAVGLLVVGCIYPLLSLWFLSRPGVKATCQAGFEAEAGE